jgi:hypothetical protein
VTATTDAQSVAAGTIRGAPFELVNVQPVSSDAASGVQLTMTETGPVTAELSGGMAIGVPASCAATAGAITLAIASISTRITPNLMLVATNALIDALPPGFWLLAVPIRSGDAGPVARSLWT